jgi:multicomponent Na+:H+ antiporter subunit G
MTAALSAISWMLLVAGSFFCLVGTLGLLRMPDVFTRVHAASVVDTLGFGFILLGLILQAGLSLVTLKLILMGLLIYFGSPTATHALVRAARIRGVKPLLAKEKGRD